jgi:hypothetical protein
MVKVYMSPKEKTDRRLLKNQVMLVFIIMLAILGFLSNIL